MSGTVDMLRGLTFAALIKDNADFKRLAFVHYFDVVDLSKEYP
jgi:hypothetical protein